MMLYRQSSAPAQARFQRRLQPGRNQEVNSRLQTKADELERLFAEHKRRARGGDHRGESSSETTTTSRGELYERYMRKREESKLRMESAPTKKEERAAAMKALRESLESCSAELKLKLLQQNPRSSSAARTRDQLEKKNFSEEEEEEEDEQSDTSYKSVNSKLLPTKRTMSSSSVGRNSNSSLTRAIPRPSAKATAATGGSARGSGSGLGSGSSDTRKENTKPPPPAIVADSKLTTNNFPRSKSTSAGLSSSSTPSRKLSATPLKPLTVLPKEQSGGGQPSSMPRTKAQNPLACVSEAALHDVVDVSSPTASTASSGSRTRNKWASDAPCQPPPRKDTGKGIKRFLQFGRRKKPGTGSVDAECSPAGARDGGEEDGTATSEVVVMSKSRYRRDGFGDHGAIALEQVQTRGSSMAAAAAAAPANCKLKEDHQSPRGVPRSFFSLPPFRNREGDSKIGR